MSRNLFLSCLSSCLPLILTLNLALHVISQANAAPVFTETSSWTLPIVEPSIHPDSDHYVDRLSDPSAGGVYHKLGYSKDAWSVPIYYADANTPTYDLGIIVEPEGNRGQNGLTAVDAVIIEEGWNLNVPVPDGAKPASGNGLASADEHMIVVSADGNSVWDFYKTNFENGIRDANGVTLVSNPKVRRIKKWDLNSDGLALPFPRNPFPDPDNVTAAPNYENLGSSRVANTPLLQGLVTYDEVDYAINTGGEINHAIAFSYGGNAFVQNNSEPKWHPVDTTNSGYSDGSWSPVLGHRYRLDPSLDLDDPANFGGSALTSGEKVIAKALQDYGMIYVENAGLNEKAIYLEDLEHDSSRSWNNLGISGLRKIEMSDFHLIAEPVFGVRSVKRIFLPSG